MGPETPECRELETLARPEYDELKCFQAGKKLPACVVEVSDWRRVVLALLPEFRESVRVELLAKEVASLKERIAALETHNTIAVPVETLSPEPYEVIRPFHVVLQAAGDDYLATFFDANISATGETQGEAIENLKDIIVTAFDMLTHHKESELGPGPLRQINVLRNFMRRVE
jgi:hypothetical protein